MAKVVVTLRGPKEVVDSIADLPEITGIERDEVQSNQSLADAVDAPIGPQEVEQILQLITVGISTATAAVELFGKVRELLRNTDASVAIVDPKNNKTLGNISAESDPQRLAGDLF